MDIVSYLKNSFITIGIPVWVTVAIFSVVLLFGDIGIDRLSGKRHRTFNWWMATLPARLLIIYVLGILIVTLLSREPVHTKQYAFIPGWSLRTMQNSWERHVILDLLLNMVLFFPLGALIVWYFHIHEQKVSTWRIVFMGLCLSLVVEVSQLLFHLGLFETDDMITNAIGCFFGASVMKLLFRLFKKKK